MINFCKNVKEGVRMIELDQAKIDLYEYKKPIKDLSVSL